MKASELIAELQGLISEGGDYDVKIGTDDQRAMALHDVDLVEGFHNTETDTPENGTIILWITMPLAG